MRENSAQSHTLVTIFESKINGVFFSSADQVVVGASNFSSLNGLVGAEFDSLVLALDLMPMAMKRKHLNTLNKSLHYACWPLLSPGRLAAAAAE